MIEGLGVCYCGAYGGGIHTKSSRCAKEPPPTALETFTRVLPDEPPCDPSDPYSELLYAVERKWPGETRHQTALRYIREAEQHANAGSAAKTEAPLSAFVNASPEDRERIGNQIAPKVAAAQNELLQRSAIWHMCGSARHDGPIRACRICSPHLYHPAENGNEGRS